MLGTRFGIGEKTVPGEGFVWYAAYRMLKANCKNADNPCSTCIDDTWWFLYSKVVTSNVDTRTNS